MESRLSDESIVVNDGKSLPTIGIRMARLCNPGRIPFRQGISGKSHGCIYLDRSLAGRGRAVYPCGLILIRRKRFPSCLETFRLQSPLTRVPVKGKTLYLIQNRELHSGSIRQERITPDLPGDAMNQGKLFGIFLAILPFIIACSNSERFSQPIAYNHKKHIEEAGLTCFDCHTQVLTHQKASIPNIQICKNCHEEKMTDSKEEGKLVDYIKKNQPIPWIQVHRVPDYAYFSHRRHVSLGKVACQDCHGDVNNMTLPFSKPFYPINMRFCTSCHEKKRVTIDCTTCHR
jgi:hypothetical protein